MTPKLFFIIGLRRSGTSILRTLIAKHPEVGSIEFEPHPLWNAMDILHFPRFTKPRQDVYGQYVQIARILVENFRKQGQFKWHGAKFALNPGVKALEWRWLYKTFPTCKIIFITRDLQNTWKSYVKQDKDSFMGMIPQNAYFEIAEQLIKDFILLPFLLGLMLITFGVRIAL